MTFASAQIPGDILRMDTVWIRKWARFLKISHLGIELSKATVRLQSEGDKCPFHFTQGEEEMMDFSSLLTSFQSLFSQLLPTLMQLLSGLFGSSTSVLPSIPSLPSGGLSLPSIFG